MEDEHTVATVDQTECQAKHALFGSQRSQKPQVGSVSLGQTDRIVADIKEKLSGN